MLPLFLYPLGFFGLLAVPTLVAIYLLRNRFRRHPVSSLMLWLDAREAREGGTKLRRMQSSLLLLLELLAVLLLAVAATDPHMRLAQGTRPLVVLLDDSFGMTAGGRDSPREQAVRALGEELRQRTPYSVQFVLAGEKPQLLGKAVRSPAEAVRLAEGWRCRAPAARLDEAMALGAEVGGELALLLVLTDHPPPKGAVPETGRVRWWSFGTPRPNVAFVNAARTARDGRDRCLFEIANLSGEPATVRFVVEHLDDGKAVYRQALPLEANGARRVTLTLPDHTPAVRARIDTDALPIDDAVTLLPPPARDVRADVRIFERGIREPVEKALRSARAELDGKRPDVLFTDSALDARAPEGSWRVRFDFEKDARAYKGPFVLDRSHPVTEGLSLRGVIWGGGKGDRSDGAPVVMAGDVPLITHIETATAAGPRHELRVRFHPEFSNLHQTPDWPILIANVLEWRAAALPGLSRHNLRLGERAVLTLPTFRESVTVQPPGAAARTVPVRGRHVALKADDVGVCEVRGGGTYAFAANALDKDESDLRGCAAGRWGDWLDETTLRLEYRGVAWVLLLLLLAVAVVHLLVMARAGSSEGRAGR